MSDLPTLLPPNAQPIEYDLEQFPARHQDFAAPIRMLWSTDACPAHMLPWLAWAFSVDDWDPDWPEETKRSAVAASIAIHRRKGTIGAVRNALAAFGYGAAAIVEGYGAFTYNGDLTHDGSEDYGEPDHWAEYRVYLERPITIDQADQLRRILENVAPERCHLKGLYFTEAAHRYNGAVTYDGAYSYGAVT